MELLERASFLRTLADYAAEARQGDGRLVLVAGESGMGKTALIEAFARETPGVRWLWGACDGLFTPRPLGPLFDIGAQLDGDLATLCRKDAPRDRLFSALVTELTSPARCTAVVIEDAHWADEATIDLISFIGRRLARIPALVLATYRDDEIGADHPLRRVLGDLATQRATRRMKLPPLSPDAVRTLACGHEVDAAELYRITGGNPFYVSEMLEAGWPSVPPTVRDAVTARLTRLDPETRRAVETAAVIGSRVPPALLAGLGIPRAAADDCVAAGLLTADGSSLRFRHELVRLAVTAGIPAARSASLHARLLAELESSDADPALLAHHAAGAADQHAVLRHAPAAGRRSAALGAHREAAAHFEHALSCRDLLTPAGPAGLHEDLAGEYALLDRWTDAETELRAGLAIRRELGDVVSAGQDLRLLSTALWRLCRGEQGEDAAREAVQVLEPQPRGPELAWAYAAYGVAAMVAGRADEGLDYVGRARALGDRLGRPDVVSYALNAIGLQLTELGRDGTAEIEQALQLALGDNLQDAAGRAYSSLQESAVSLHRFEDADRYYAAGMAYCEDRELGVFAKCIRGGRAWGLLLRGHWDEALLGTGTLLAEPGISPVNQLNPLRVQGAIQARRGDPAGWDRLDEAAALADGVAEPSWIMPIRALRAELRWTQDEADLAALEVLAGHRYQAGQIDPWAAWSLTIWLARLGIPAELPADPPAPYALEVAGQWRAAADAWDALGRPWDAALVLMVSGDEAGLRTALDRCDDLGARASGAAVRRRMRALGVQSIPRGPRPATKSAPARLTAREQEVLALLTQGLPDREISRALVISERTVHHHVSAVLAKIGVNSRTAAVREAARLGIGSGA
jgi:DNA-binding CsgD family transcriptional regulator